MYSGSSSGKNRTIRSAHSNRNGDNSSRPFGVRVLRNFTEGSREQSRFRQEARQPSVQSPSRVQQAQMGSSAWFGQGSSTTSMDDIRSTQWRAQQGFYGSTTPESRNSMETGDQFLNRIVKEHHYFSEFSRKMDEVSRNRVEDSPQTRLQLAMEEIRKKQDLHPLLVSIPMKPLETEERRKLKEERAKILFAEDVEEALKEFLTKHSHPWGQEDFPDVGKSSRITEIGTMEQSSASAEDNEEDNVPDYSSDDSYHTGRESTPDSSCSDTSNAESPDNTHGSSKDLESFTSQSSFDESIWMSCDEDLNAEEIQTVKINSYGYFKTLFGSVLATSQDSILFDTIALQILKKSAGFVDRTISKMEPSNGILYSVMKRLTGFLNRKYVHQYSITERKRKKLDGDDEDDEQSHQAKRKRSSDHNT